MAKLARKGMYVPPGVPADLKSILTSGQCHRLEVCLQTMDASVEDVIDVAQNLDWTSVSQYAPCLLQNSVPLAMRHIDLCLGQHEACRVWEFRVVGCYPLLLRLWCRRAQRLALPVEHLTMQGIPVLQDLEPALIPRARSWCQSVEGT